LAELLIDVGANQGEFAIEVAVRNPDRQVLAIEPLPELCERLQAQAAARGAGNVRLAPFAVDATERTATFHVAGTADQGVSSLLRFHADGLRNDAYWRQREDLHFDRTLQVPVRRLDSLPEVKAADRIRFVKIDAQGVDLGVLESLGEHLVRTDGGVLEAPATLGGRLYEEERHDLRAVLVRLAELGFVVHAIKPNDPAANEFNVHFCRAGVDPAGLERELGLRGIRVYDGKHFWHLPSDRLHPEAALDPAALLGRLAQLDDAVRTAEARLAPVSERLAVVESALARECEETRRLGAAVAERDAQIVLMHRAMTLPR
jgi:FkbM family methyltransferase